MPLSIDGTCRWVILWGGGEILHYLTSCDFYTGESIFWYLLPFFTWQVADKALVLHFSICPSLHPSIICRQHRALLSTTQFDIHAGTRQIFMYLREELMYLKANASPTHCYHCLCKFSCQAALSVGDGAREAIYIMSTMRPAEKQLTVRDRYIKPKDLSV